MVPLEKDIRNMKKMSPDSDGGGLSVDPVDRETILEDAEETAPGWTESSRTRLVPEDEADFLSLVESAQATLEVLDTDNREIWAQAVLDCRYRYTSLPPEKRDASVFINRVNVFLTTARKEAVGDFRETLETAPYSSDSEFESTELESTEDRATLELDLDEQVRRLQQENVGLRTDLTNEKLTVKERDSKILELQKLVIEDPLTGLFNRRAYDNALEELQETIDSTARFSGDGEQRGEVQSLEPTSIIMLDLDHFKLVNDSHGHPAGDSVLSGLGEIINTSIRRKGHEKEAAGYRFGGEEFAVIVKGDVTIATHIANRIGARVKADLLKRAQAEADPTENLGTNEEGDQLFSITERTNPITISIGVTTLREGETAEQFKGRADGYLYQAKKGDGSRDRMVVEGDVQQYS